MKVDTQKMSNHYTILIKNNLMQMCPLDKYIFISGAGLK